MAEQKPRAALYAREMGNDGPDGDHGCGADHPPELRKLLRDAAGIPRPFETVIVATPKVLGNAEQQRRAREALMEYGITVQAADEQAIA